jgi:hypothetical protein
MIDIEVALEELKLIVNRNIYDYLIPEQQGNTIRIGYMIIRYSKSSGYLIFDSRKQTQVANTYSKYAALAFSKSYMLGTDTYKVLMLDKKIEKNETDIIFFQNTIDNSQDDIRKSIANDRKVNCEVMADSAKQQLEILLFDK